MKRIFPYIIMSILLFPLASCIDLGPHMPPYTPQPFPELNGKAFAVLVPWKVNPSRGAYLVIYDLENLRVAKQIPLDGVSAFDRTCHYWNGKYYFQNVKLDFNWSWIRENNVGVVDSSDGNLKFIPIHSFGHTTGITQDGKFYILSNFYDRKRGIPVTIINTKDDTATVKYYTPSATPMGTFSEMDMNYINPVSGYAYFWEQYTPQTRILRFRTSDDALEEVYNFRAEIQALHGVPSPDGKRVYVAINYKNVLTPASPDILNKQNTLVVIDAEKKKLVEVVDLPSPKWLLGVDIQEGDWGTAWIATYKDWVYITAWKEPDVVERGVLFKYNVKTGEFKMIGKTPAMFSLDIVGDKLVAITSYVNEDLRLTVLDLETDEFLVYDEELNLHE